MRILGGLSFLFFFVLVLVACGGDSTVRDAGPMPDAPTADAHVGGDASLHCASNADCADGVYCNGDELCQPGSAAADARGCVTPPGARCAMGQACDETMSRCVTDCGVAVDADGDGHQAIVCGGDDCDDADATRYPGNAEVCDDAAHDEDCDAATFGHRDADGDGSIDALCCNVGPTGMRICGDDCNDARTHIGPHATEVCNGVDDDCNGMIDEGVLVAAFEDHDHDLHGDAAHAVMACPFAAGISLIGDDCDDANPARHPAQPEICDGVDNDCNGTVDDFTRAVTWYADLDGDLFGNAASGTMISCTPLPGFSLLPTDCDDAHRGVSPAANEVCNGLDDDCNGLLDFVVAPGDFEDDDGDGAVDARCPRVGTDCDDLDAAVHPSAPEICDGKDDDCNGMIDDGTGNATWFADLDADGYGDDHAPTMMSCTQPAGRVARGGDCDDSADAVHPGAIDACNGHDDDCDGVVDDDSPRFAYYADADGDGAGIGLPILACTAPLTDGTIPNDCDDTDAAIHPGALELCNGIDDDCDGSIDDAAMITFYPDVDHDGHGELGSVGHLGCAPGSGYAPSTDDCDDSVASVHPGATETCNGLDDDCNGTVDGTSAASMCTAAHGTSTCTAGACAIASCTTGFADCDAAAFDGCETDTRTAFTHCGMCGHTCAAGDTCVAGTCTVSPVVQVSAGTYFMCARRAAGGVACWGEGATGQLGTGSAVSSTTPLTSLVTDAIDVATGDSHACAIRRGGQVVCWGSNSYGELGDGSRVNRAAPAAVLGVTDAVDVAAGYDYTCAVRATGAVTCWGYNALGELGVDPSTMSSAPVPQVVPGITDAVAVTLSYYAACALHASGQISCWGANASGQLGDGTTVSRFTPAPVVGITGASAFTSFGSGNGFCAIVASGDSRCWGASDYGQFGNGLNGSYSVPVVTVGIHDALAIPLLSRYVGCWLRAGGTVTCSGYGGEGERGDGTLGTIDTPGPDIPMLSGVRSLTGGFDSLCAALSTGGVVCWGANTRGELGNGTIRVQALVPTPVIGLP